MNIPQDAYTLISGKFIKDLYSVDNFFIRQVANLAASSASNLRYVSIVKRDYMNNRGEIARKGVSQDDKSVIDVCKLSPLMNFGNSRNVLEEIAAYRRNMLQLQNLPYDNKIDSLLFLDYILSSCVCYVEVFDNSAKVNKFFATRNRFIASDLAKIPPNESAKYTNYLTPYASDYVNGTLRVLKLNTKKDGFSITQPRSALNFNQGIKITPVFLMNIFLNNIKAVLENKAIKFTFIKDNSVEREMIATLSPGILMNYYNDEAKVQQVLANVGLKLNRGYVKVPELGLSKYDDTGVRALNIARITSLEAINNIDKSFVDVDFNNIMPTFRLCIDNCNNLNTLNYIIEALAKESKNINSLVDAKSFLMSYIDSQYAIGSTTFLKYLHKFMLDNNYMFNNYSGKVSSFVRPASSFNMGME